jgi:hypothetical protein
MKYSIPFLMLILGSMLIFSDAASQGATPMVKPAATLEVIQFHLQHRCVSCNKMEEYSREVVKNYTGATFKIYNVEDKKNEKLAEQFKASGTSLYLYNPKNGRIKDLTTQAFMNVGNKDKFEQHLKKNMDDFQKAL